MKTRFRFTVWMLALVAWLLVFNWWCMGWWYDRVDLGTQDVVTETYRLQVDGGFVHSAYGNYFGIRMTQLTMQVTIRNLSDEPQSLFLKLENRPATRRIDSVHVTMLDIGDYTQVTVDAGQVAQITVNSDIDPRDFSFAVVSDVHGNMHNLLAIMSDLKTKNLDFVIGMGDLAIGGRLQSLETVTDVFARRCKFPIYFAPGNHDLNRDNTSEHFQRVYGRPFDVLPVGDTLLVLMDNAKEEIGPLQQSWITGELQHRNTEYSQFLVFSHYPLVALPAIGYTMLPPDEREWVREFLSHPKCKAAFSGAKHVYRELHSDETPVYVAGGGGGAMDEEGPFFYLTAHMKDGNLEVEKHVTGNGKRPWFAGLQFYIWTYAMFLQVHAGIVFLNGMMVLVWLWMTWLWWRKRVMSTS